MSSHAANGVVKTSVQRPQQLPYQSLNPYLMTDNTKLPGVKFQVIMRDGQEIIVGRVKIQTPGGGHAFVLRRFDTGAISQTTMFRAAFPSASDELEKSEATWVKQNFDSQGANGGAGKDVLRLAGVWVRPEVAKHIAPAYQLEHVIEPLMTAHPDPGQEYRRSTKPATPQANGSTSPAKPPSSSSANAIIEVPTPSSPPGSPKPKRRREASPAVLSPKKSATAAETLPPPRRSNRVTSPVPVPSSAAQPVRTTRTRVSKTITTKVTARSEPTGRLTPADEEEEYDAGDEIPDALRPNMHEDIAEQKELIAKLKAERDKEAVASDSTPSAVPLEQTESQASSSKRSREDESEQLKFEFREPDEQAVLANRQIRSNRRISLDLEPQQKSAAWGALWFAAGLAAAATIPSLFM